MRTMDEKRETGIAVLIDGENVGASFAGKVLGILRSLGRIDIGNVYFDLQRGQSVEWIRDLPSLPLEPVVTAVEETGRSGSDISLVLDAVEILHTQTSVFSASARRTATSPALHAILRPMGRK